jgi:hypothetical protein
VLPPARFKPPKVSVEVIVYRRRLGPTCDVICLPPPNARRYVLPLLNGGSR